MSFFPLTISRGSCYWHQFTYQAQC